MYINKLDKEKIKTIKYLLKELKQYDLITEEKEKRRKFDKEQEFCFEN